METQEISDKSDVVPTTRPPLRPFWKVGIGFVVVLAALAGAGIGGAMIRITCESGCAVAYAGATGLGLIFGGLGTLILAVLVGRSMQEWQDWNAEHKAEHKQATPD